MGIEQNIDLKKGIQMFIVVKLKVIRSIYYIGSIS